LGPVLIILIYFCVFVHQFRSRRSQLSKATLAFLYDVDTRSRTERIRARGLAPYLLKFIPMEDSTICFPIQHPCRASLLIVMLCAALPLLRAQAPGVPPAATSTVPDWALPGSPTHKQVPPPADFHRPSQNFATPIGLFDGQSDIGGAVVAGSAAYDSATKQYTINSAGYNIWYSRDEFRYLWKKVSGDVSLAADVTFPDPKGYGDRKAVLVIRQNLDDDSKEAMIGEHGVGMIHLAQRAERGANLKDMQYRFGGALANVHAKRIGIEKHGDFIAIFVSLEGEPIQQLGPPIQLHFDEAFYVGIGFCSHLPDKSDTAVLSNVVLENSAGKIH
jgi:hypothetical protein